MAPANISKRIEAEYILRLYYCQFVQNISEIYRHCRNWSKKTLIGPNIFLINGFSNFDCFQDSNGKAPCMRSFMLVVFWTIVIMTSRKINLFVCHQLHKTHLHNSLSFLVHIWVIVISVSPKIYFDSQTANKFCAGK